jgi:hypothetical protein
MGPWVPLVAVLAVYLLAGLHISLRGAEDDPRSGYVAFGLSLLAAGAAIRFRRQPRAMAAVCIALIVLSVALAALALATWVIPFGLGFGILMALNLVYLSLAAWLFRQRA